MNSKVQHKLDKALKHHGAGRLDKARPLYQKVLKTDPGNIDALHMLGVLLHQCADYNKALTLLQRALKFGPVSPALHTNYGNLLQVMGQPEEAITAFEAAIALDPEFVPALEKLGDILYSRAALDKAMACYQKAVKFNPTSVTALSNLGKLAMDSGDADQAISYFRRVLAMDASSPVARVTRHMLAALQGETTHSAPVEYVTKLFDDIAGNFDKILVDDLHYIVPDALKAIVDKLCLLNDKTLDIADLGCGTGLCGQLFRDQARTLTGIDLSPGMLAKAKERKIYDALIAGDIVAGLAQSGKTYDLILCGDVFIYIGDLEKAFHAVASALKPGGLFAYSAESAENESDYVLRPTGRFAQSLRYLRRLASEANLEEVHLEDKALRYEKEKPINGYILALRRPRGGN